MICKIVFGKRQLYPKNFLRRSAAVDETEILHYIPHAKRKPKRHLIEGRSLYNIFGSTE